MKRMLICCAVLALVLPLAYGQSPAPRYKAEIPFAFQVGDKGMPAGSYELDVRHASGGVLVFVRSSTDSSTGVMRVGALTRQPWAPGDQAKLVFYKYDNDHAFLRQVIHAAAEAGIDLPSCRLEREHVSSTFRPVAGTSPARVVILASLR